MHRLSAMIGFVWALAVLMPFADVTAEPNQDLARHVLTAEDVSAWLDGYMPYAIGSADVVGAVVTIVKDGKVLVNRGYGYADLEKRLPVDPEKTLFRPASISKLFTWTAVMQLVEKGMLDLDHSVDTYLDFDLPMPQGDITLRHLMTHTAGFEEVIKDGFLRDGNLPDDYLRNYLVTHIPAQIYKPGEVPAYSNYATALAGYIVQRVSGQSFEDYMDAQIFEPLGMEHSTFRQPLPPKLEQNLSRGYKSLSDGEAQPFEVMLDLPAGVLSATASDMARFMIAYLADGAGLMAPHTARMMHGTLDSHFPPLNSMALGFYQKHRNGLQIIGHGGDLEFFHSDLSLILDKNVGFFISMNSRGSGMYNLLIRDNILAAFVDRYFPQTSAERPALPTVFEHGRALVGTYESSRRPATNAFAAGFSLMQTKVRLKDNGDVVFSFIPDLNGADKTWREVEPWVWQANGGKERLAARLVNGRVVSFTAEPLSPVAIYMRVPWWRSSAWLMPATGGALGLFVLTLVAYPMRAFARWRFAAAFPLSGSLATAHRMTFALSFIALAYVLGWVGFFAWLLSSPLDNLAGAKNEGPATILYVAAIAPLISAVGFGWVNFVVWRDRAGWFAKVGAAALLAAASIVIWLAWVNKLFSFNLNY